MITYPYYASAIRVEQPLGTYYVTVLPARLLLDVAFSHAMNATIDPSGMGYTVDGTQRLQRPKRIDQITDYIDRDDAAFPNSIILAANFDPSTGTIEDSDPLQEDKKENEQLESANDPEKIWFVEGGANGCFRLCIPSAKKLAAIIDGQHRLFSFAKAKAERLDMDLICAIFLDLPKPFQAQLFATINSTQKPVDKSLTYELFGYNISDEKEEYWAPDKLSVFLTRKLNTDPDSPLRGRIIVAPKRDAALLALNDAVGWRVSTAVIVEGILRLISSNPKRDTNEMMTPPVKSRRELGLSLKDKSPLRDVYLDTNDLLLYKLIINYLKACDEVFWSKAKPGSFIVKTVGVQALLDLLRKIGPKAYREKDVRAEYFARWLRPAGNIDFTEDRFRNASGSGRSIIRRAIEDALIA